MISASVANIDFKRDYGRRVKVDPAKLSTVWDMEWDRMRVVESVRRTSGFDGHGRGG
jgi:hypothetical protein